MTEIISRSGKPRHIFVRPHLDRIIPAYERASGYQEQLLSFTLLSLFVVIIAAVFNMKQDRQAFAACSTYPLNEYWHTLLSERVTQINRLTFMYAPTVEG